MAYVITGRHDFSINGVSARTVGLVVDDLNPPPMAEPRYTVSAVGSDADFVTPDGAYNDIEYHIPARVICPESFDNTAIYAFLADARTLQISVLPGKYFRIQRLLGITPAATVRGKLCTYDIGLILAPFKYHTSNAPVTPTGTIENPGTRYARPVYCITHSGACKLTVNGEVLTIAAGASSPIYIDTARMIAHDANGVNQTVHTTGKFPFLQPGINTISTTGTGLSVTGNWRDY